jgi:hypothetical protein
MLISSGNNNSVQTLPNFQKADFNGMREEMDNIDVISC